MRVLIAFLSIALFSAPASAQDRVRLTFDWPAGLNGTVTTTTEQSTGAAGMQMTQRTVTTQRIETEDHPQGLLVRYRDGELVESSAPAMPGMDGTDALTRTIAEASFDMVVDEQGALVEVTRDSATMAKIEAALQEMMAPLQAMPGAEGVTEMLEGMMSDDALNANVQQSWSSAVGIWTQDELVIGETLATREEAPFPMMQNRTLLMDLKTTVHGRVACADGRAADSCIRVVVESTVDPDDMRAMMDEMFGEMFGSLGAGMELSIEIGAFEQLSTVETVLEPATMLPYSVTMTSTADVEMTMMGQTMPTQQEMTMTIVYDWEGH